MKRGARRNKGKTLAIFADLLIETSTGVKRVDVQEPGWLAGMEPLLASATRIGLALCREQKPRVWMCARGGARYFSKVFGRIDQNGHQQARVACVESGGVRAWLHRDGTVEVGAKPNLQNEFK